MSRILLIRIVTTSVLLLTIMLIIYVTLPCEKSQSNNSFVHQDYSIPSNGLIGWYNSFSFDKNLWNDLSGNENNIIIKSDLPKIQVYQNYVKGIKKHTFDFLNDNFTFYILKKDDKFSLYINAPPNDSDLDIGEILVYNRSLSDIEINQVKNYLVEKFNFQLE